jgi:hypothetical protein
MYTTYEKSEEGNSETIEEQRERVDLMTFR